VIRLVLTAGALAVAPLAAQGQAQTSAPAAAPDPARVAAGARVAAQLVPEGAYLRIMRDQFPQMMDAMMTQMGSLKASDVGGKGTGSAIDAARSADPHFEERMRIMTRVMGEEMGPLMGRLEPQVRAGLSGALARRFTAAQLADMAAFFATPSGSALAGSYLSLMADPEMMREMASATPEIIRAMPAIMAKVEAATKHLPPPPKKASEPAQGEDE
jgi:hypothetical protein